MTDKNITRLEESIDTIDNLKIAIEPTVNSDTGVKSLGYKDSDGVARRCLTTENIIWTKFHHYKSEGASATKDTIAVVAGEAGQAVWKFTVSIGGFQTRFFTVNASWVTNGSGDLVVSSNTESEYIDSDFQVEFNVVASGATAIILQAGGYWQNDCNIEGIRHTQTITEY